MPGLIVVRRDTSEDPIPIRSFSRFSKLGFICLHLHCVQILQPRNLIMKGLDSVFGGGGVGTVVLNSFSNII